jgi:hypothetical protein
LLVDFDHDARESGLRGEGGFASCVIAPSFIALTGVAAAGVARRFHSLFAMRQRRAYEGSE